MTPAPLLKACTYRPAVARTLVKSAGAGTVRANLTYPDYDLDNDWVNPSGGDWSAYPRNPVVDWDHGIPVGRGAVTLHKATVAGKPYVLPVGTTTFFKSLGDLNGLDLAITDRATNARVGTYDRAACLEHARQLAELVDRGVVPGVSLELSPVRYRKSGRRSTLSGRDGLVIDEWVGHRWAHTATPVNPRAGLIEEDAALSKAVAVAAAGKVGGIPLLPAIRKSFDPLKQWAESQARTTVTVPRTVKAAESDRVVPAYHGAYPGDRCPECDQPPKAACRCLKNDRWCPNGHSWRRLEDGSAALVDGGHGPIIKTYPTLPRTVKAAPMNEDEIDAIAPDPADDGAGDDAPGTGAATPGAMACMDLAQQVTDLIAAFKAGVSQSEHAKLRTKFLPRIVADLEDAAAQAKAMGEQIAAEVGEIADDVPDPTEGDDADPVETDADGAMVVTKAVRHVFKGKAFRRLKASELTPVSAARAGDDPAALQAALTGAASLRRQIRQLTRQMGR